MTTVSEAILSYESTSDEVSTKLFLCKSSESGNSKNHFGRIFHINEKIMVDINNLNDAYRAGGEYSLQSKLIGGKTYTLVVSTFDMNYALGGTLSIESDFPLIIKKVPEEGLGNFKQVFNDSWNFNNAGGCKNFPTFDMNPAYVIKVI